METGIHELLEMQRDLMAKVPHDVRADVERSRTAGLGVIEEVLEYLNALGHKPWRPDPLPLADQLEELVDILFFYLELIILSEFPWERIVAEYRRKHAVNLKRYEDARKGDRSWDDRATKNGL